MHTKRIQQKLHQCKPAFNFLFIAGFKYSNNKTRLIWKNTNNNVQSLQNVYDTLQSMANNVKATHPSTGNKWKCKVCKLINDDISPCCQICGRSKAKDKQLLVKSSVGDVIYNCPNGDASQYEARCNSCKKRVLQSGSINNWSDKECHHILTLKEIMDEYNNCLTEQDDVNKLYDK